jgi:hypothetical protein
MDGGALTRGVEHFVMRETLRGRENVLTVRLHDRKNVLHDDVNERFEVDFMTYDMSIW